MKFGNILLASLALVPMMSLPLDAETPEQKAERMEWFSRAKLGIFIHWGIYSKGETSESWAFHNGTISIEDYMKQREAFTAANYDPAYWARLIKESGARYTVITTKHHDGFALWDTKAGDDSAVKNSPAGRDVLAPFAEEVRKQGLKLGFYFSLIDWPRDDYPIIYRNGPAKYDIHKEPKRWQHFVDFNFAQLRELNAWKPDLYWFDGDWEQTAGDWRAKEIVEMLRETNPGVIVNSRIQGYGDYATPELGVPVTRPESQWWETCMTMNNHWGYAENDHDFKEVSTVMTALTQCVSKNGNLLFNVGPDSRGNIPEEGKLLLRGIAEWFSHNGEAVTGAGEAPFTPPSGMHYTAAGEKTLYLHIPFQVMGDIILPQLRGKVAKITLLQDGSEVQQITWWGEELLQPDELRIRTRPGKLTLPAVLKLELL